MLVTLATFGAEEKLGGETNIAAHTADRGKVMFSHGFQRIGAEQQQQQKTAKEKKVEKAQKQGHSREG